MMQVFFFILILGDLSWQPTSRTIVYLPFTRLKKNYQVTDVFWQFFAGKKINLIFIGAQWTNAGLDPQISKFNGQGWTEKYEGWEMVQNASKIKSREISGKVPGQKKNQDNKKSRDQKKAKKMK